MAALGWYRLSAHEPTTIFTEKMTDFPEEVETVSEVWAVACRLEPGVEAERSTETSRPTAESRCWTTDRSSTVGLCEDLKQIDVMFVKRSCFHP